MNLSITFLGTGTSTGIPMLGCNCNVCTSSNPFNKRLRTSFLLQTKKTTIVFDTGPDLRTQLLRENVQDVNGVIISHPHADHLNGIDDIRPFTFNHPINLYTSSNCARVIHERFGYIFGSNKGHIGSSPRLLMNEININEKMKICELECEFLQLPHGNGTSLGLLTDKLAIISDCHEIADQTLLKLKNSNLDALIIDCVREEPHRSHLNVEKCFSYIKEIGAKQSFLTHMGHELEHDSLQSKCNEHFPAKNVKVAYDGMKFDV
ncbi:beta-lactamase family protein [Halobacteriovorax sp. BALOs_7]|uniref:MBL fold metallo-hydrolase n=1 Tax=Halobacteriovorax sp. BALOs_7 TaxID=2109558 RepID=UPI000EA39E14|nr:MBL fold metallo-hydrolase [Halobacteriovorax sp. BALOs_7]AYF44229.1 beta-lactamase family protein [Halobacteriovorax sp. BALOs_7]